MDLLSKAYSEASDDEAKIDAVSTIRAPNQLPPPHPKRFRTATPTNDRTVKPVFRTMETPVAGGYVSKRQRALLAAKDDLSPKPTDSDPNQFSSSQVVGSISDSDIPRGILMRLRRHQKGGSFFDQTTQSLSWALDGHAKPVNAMQWSKTHSHLLASASLDHTVSIWNVWSGKNKQARIFSVHHAAVKDVKWSPQGLSILSCGYDCSSRLIDVEKGVEVQFFKEDQIIEVVKFSPSNYNLFISGGSKGGLKLWDVRSGKVAHEYVRNLGSILDVEFTLDGKNLITSSDISRTNLSENSIIVWDVSRQIPLSNQVYTEAYTCPCIKHHPFEPYFIAQSNGNYVAIFSSKPPYKLDKYKRYEGHGVSGFPIKCNFSTDGKIIVSGSSDGSIYFYDSKTSKLLKKINVYDQACIDVEFHPILPDVVATCSWKGEVSVLQQDWHKKF